MQCPLLLASLQYTIANLPAAAGCSIVYILPADAVLLLCWFLQIDSVHAVALVTAVDAGVLAFTQPSRLLICPFAATGMIIISASNIFK